MKGEAENVVLLNNVSKIYKTSGQSSTGVNNINFFAKKGELVLLLGPSGSGKTTLLTLIAGLLKPSQGKVFLFGKEIESYNEKELQKIRAGKIGFIFQTFLLIDALTARQNIEIVIRFILKSRKTAKEISDKILKDLSIEHLSEKLPALMSQGEKQRIAVARAIANDADLILADEPTASLEVNQGIEIIKLLHSYAKNRNKCVIVVSHDLRLKNYADRIIYLEEGSIYAHLSQGYIPLYEDEKKIT
ncbi:MAG TPA: ABC transporter ATP-binding protein [Ignavibacteriaceae bacterium]|nr:ABC transporter ATP-binding protein [Ignavibacteriaceae bacterium]